MNTQSECCPRFNPDPWNEKELNWENRQFVTARIRSIFHIPLNFGAVMKKNVELIESADAKPEDMLVLSDENSLWGADIYISVTKVVPGAKMATLSGTFMSKVFEGPYKNMGKWYKEMEEYVKASGKDTKKVYSYYTTCPKCSKKYSENYVVLLAQI